MRNMPGRVRQAGFSLVELMVSMLVGMMVVGALMAGYYAIFVNNRHTQAMAQITEDAAVAFSMLRGQIALAGYSRPIGASGTKFDKAYNGAALAGCDGAFTKLDDAIGALDCAAIAGGTAADSIAVAYEADASNSVSSGGVPLDCLGNALTVIGVAPNAYYLSYSRLYLDDSKVAGRKALYCRGPVNASGQALVENIADLQIQYGVSKDLAAVPVSVAYYATASELASGSANDIAAKMAAVVSVRLCIVVASNDEVMDEVTDYIDCQQAKVTPGDKRMYRAFHSTVLLHNRAGAA